MFIVAQLYQSVLTTTFHTTEKECYAQLIKNKYDNLFRLMTNVKKRTIINSGADDSPDILTPDTSIIDMRQLECYAQLFNDDFTYPTHLYEYDMQQLEGDTFDKNTLNGYISYSILESNN